MKIKGTLTNRYFIPLKQKLFLQTWQSVWRRLSRTQIKRRPSMTDSHDVLKWVWVIFLFCFVVSCVCVCVSQCWGNPPSKCQRLLTEAMIYVQTQWWPGCSRINFRKSGWARAVECIENTASQIVVYWLQPFSYTTKGKNNNLDRYRLVKYYIKLWLVLLDRTL